MIVSRIWVVILAVAAVTGLAVARLVPNPAAREITKTYAENLDRGQHNAELILRLEARDWIDAVAKMAWDGTVIDLLEQASNRRGDVKTHSGKLSGRLLSLLGLTRVEPRPQLIIAVDHRGKQIARVGPGEDRFTPGEDGLAGYPLVEAALRGYRADDTWSLDGKLLLMAASPVISRSRGRYVGALLVGLEMNDAFARRLKSRLAGTDLSFFLHGKLVASTVHTSGLDSLPAEFAKRAEEIARHGRSAVIRFGSSMPSPTAILAALPGEAAQHGAFYAAVGAPVPAVGLSEMLGQLNGADLRLSEFPWPLILGLLVIAVAIGLALLWWEHSAPLRRLLLSAQKLGTGDAIRLNEFIGGGFGHLAKTINENNEKLRRSSTGVGKETGRTPALLDTTGPVDFASLGATMALDDRNAQPSIAIGHDTGLASRTVPPLDKPDAGFAQRRSQDPPSHRERATYSLPSSTEPALPGPGGPPALAPIDIPSLSVTVTASRDQGPVGQEESAPALDGSQFELEPVLAPRPSLPMNIGHPVRLPELEPVAPQPPSFATPQVPKPLSSNQPRLPSATPEESFQALNEAFTAADATPIAAQALNPEEEYFKSVFEEFLDVKQQCGENISSLTYDRFVEKLRKNRESLIKNYGCKSVKFQVYVKDGKAALKATPIK